MPACPQPVMNEFLRQLRAVNKTIDSGLGAKVFGKSSLQPLVALLKSPNCEPLGIYRAIAALEPASVTKYQIALAYLLRSFPELSATGIQVDDLKKQPIKQTRAALYRMCPTPANFKPDGPQAQRVFVQPRSAFMGGSIIEYLLANPAAASILLIHLGPTTNQGALEAYNQRFTGRSTLEYITSVLRVARVIGCPVGTLSMAKAGQEPLRPELNTEFRLVPGDRRTLIEEPTLHTATNQPAMLTFLRLRGQLVVMGYDGNICVPANVFGSDERMGGEDRQFRPPLINFADIIMSRATVVTTGQLWTKTATMGKAEYGPLYLLGPN